MSEFLISGIQQVGIGVSNVTEAFKWYNTRLGMDVPVFEEAAEAKLMLPYTGGMPHKRHAILAINMKGGGGFEIWQYTSRTPEAPKFKPQLGDLGLYCAKMKCENAEIARQELKAGGATILGDISSDLRGKKHFFIVDPYGNHFEIVEDDIWFGKGLKNTGGPIGMIIGVSDLEKSIRFYGDVLGYDKVISLQENNFNDLSALPGGNRRFRRAILTHSESRKGPFSQLFGNGYIELVQLLDEPAKKIFENRFWGDLGFIHLCFDIKNMEALKKNCEKNGHPFTVDGGAGFEMGEAAGHFTYIEDPDGALIEFVETKKIPILKKLGWYLDLTKRPMEKPLPKWMLQSMGLNRKKF